MKINAHFVLIATQTKGGILMLIQIFKTTCEDCGKQLENKVGVLNGGKEIIVDFIDGMEFYCESCEATTYIQVEKYTG